MSVYLGRFLLSFHLTHTQLKKIDLASKDGWGCIVTDVSYTPHWECWWKWKCPVVLGKRLKVVQNLFWYEQLRMLLTARGKAKSKTPKDM